MRRAIHPLPNTFSWRGAQLKHRDNFTFTFIDLMGIGWEDVDWIHLAQDMALMNTAVNLQVP
jgi:hypothetical protein